MEQQRYLIDTNVVIDYLGNKLPNSGMGFMNSIIDAVPTISVVTKIEVLGFNTPDEPYQLLISFMNDAHIIGLTDSIVEKCMRSVKIIKLNYLMQSSQQQRLFMDLPS